MRKIEDKRVIKRGGEYKVYKTPCWSNRIICCQGDEACVFSQVCLCTDVTMNACQHHTEVCVTVKLMKTVCVNNRFTESATQPLHSHLGHVCVSTHSSLFCVFTPGIALNILQKRDAALYV